MLDFNDAPRQGRALQQVKSFPEAMTDAGLTPPTELIPDGEIHRFTTTGDKNNERSGWYVLYNGGIPAGAAGDWRQGIDITWSARGDIPPGDERQLRERMEQMRAVKEKERTERHAAAADRAREIWEASKEVESHPYLGKKNVKAHGIRHTSRGDLIVPLYDVHGKIRTAQFIPPNGGAKRFLTGGEKRGHFFAIPGEGDRVYVVEGYATGATIHEATGATVVVAFDAGNLAPVCQAWKDKGRLIVCADNDHQTAGNPGVTKAQETGQTVIVPEGMAGSDFNDLAQEKGLQEVKRQLGIGSNYRINLQDWGLDRYQGPAPERRWLISNTVPMGAVTVLSAKGDAGKGMLMLDLSLKVGGQSFGVLDPPSAFGNLIQTHGAAVIFTAEDDQAEVHRRLEHLGHQGSERVHIVPLPNAGGPAPIVVPGKNGPEATPLFYELKEQLKQIPDLVLVNFDPLASFVMADINADPAVGAFTMALLASIGTETGAAVIVCHHLSKTTKHIYGHDDARNLVRGSTAIVDGARAVYVLWSMDDKRSKQVCQALGRRWAPNQVCQGCVVKSNGPADRDIKTFVRNEHSGLLEIKDDSIRQVIGNKNDQLLALLEQDIANAAGAGFPFVQSGRSEMTLYKRRNELTHALQDCGRQKLEKLSQTLLDEGRIAKCRAKGSKLAQWLDVPGGQFYLGNGEFPEGARN